MNAYNFLARLSWVVSGQKPPFLKEIELPMLSAVRVAASGIPIGTATAPTATTAGCSFANGETALLHFDVPQDYDEGVDELALRLHEVPAAAHATDTTLLGVTTAQSIYRAGAVVNTTVSTSVAEAATASVTTAKVRENVLDISGRGYKAGDHIILTLSATCTSTELILLGIDLIYASCIRGFNDADRYRALGL